jgi:transposase
MDAKASGYLPYIFRSFQGFQTVDVKEFRKDCRMELILESNKDRVRLCNRCGHKLGPMHDRYWVKARHLKAFNWNVEVCFFREKRWCENCQKVRSEWIDWICPTSPHMTLELCWWLNRLSEITSVLAVSKLESVDKMTCYGVDKYILQRLLQGYKIPSVTHISVDEVYARSARQQKEDETRDDLFLTVIVDHRTHKVIWVSQSRRKEALDTFFEVIGPEACKQIEVVTCDQHRGYAESVAQYCPRADLVWDRYHLVESFNKALNEERKEEWEKYKDEEADDDLMHGKYRYIYLTKAKNRSAIDRQHIAQVMSRNQKIAQMEFIKEHFHRIFEETNVKYASSMLTECYEWATEIKAYRLAKYFWDLFDRKELLNFFKHRLTSGVSEGINRAIKGLKWQAYGYKDMTYFALKIMQKCGYLNSKHALSWLYNENNQPTN